MRLTLALFKRPAWTHGHYFRGKYKVLPKVRYWMTEEIIADAEREEKNMFLLRHHYLTKEQVYKYSVDLGKRAEFIANKRSIACDNFPKHIRIEDQLGSLRFTDSWDK